jgi:Glycosyl-hydrolase 97 N-terminal/Glycoside hydrolase 97
MDHRSHACSACGRGSGRASSCSRFSGRVRIELALRDVGEAKAAPHYRVTFAGKEVVGYSRLGVELAGGSALGGSCEIVALEARSIREEYTQITGKNRAITAHASEVVAALQETTAPRRRWQVVLRAYDDRAAFRYHFPKQDGFESLVIKLERTEVRFPIESKAVALRGNGLTTSYEKRYQKLPVEDLPKDWLLGLPLLVDCPGGTCPKPTGLERTFPNLLTEEGVMNLEYDKWDKIGITPDHEVTVPFSRNESAAHFAVQNRASRDPRRTAGVEFFVSELIAAACLMEIQLRQIARSPCRS